MPEIPATTPHEVEPLAPPHVLVRGRHGRFIANRNDLYIGRSLISYGEFSELECRLLRQLVAPGNTVVELGANIGALSVPLALAIGPSGRFVAIEPEPRHARLLEANLALNGLSEAEVLRVACGAAAGAARLDAFDPNTPGNFGGVQVRLGEGSEANDSRLRVDVAPLDELVRTDRLDLLKIDAEGMEGEILVGACATLARHRPTLYLENDRRDRSRALIEQIESLDYLAWWHLPPLFNPDNTFGQSANLFPGLVSVNLLALPRERPIHLEGFRRALPDEPHPLSE
jgi:FkbM family methyltransferase